MIAAFSGNFDDLQRAYSLNPKGLLEKNGWNNSTALMLAAHGGDPKIMKFILDALRDIKELDNQINLRNTPSELKVDPNSEIQGNTALIIAAEFGHLEVVKLLCGANADHKLKGLYGHTALILASENNHVEVVKYLVELDESQLKETNKYGKNAVVVSVEFASVDVARWLIDEKKVDVNMATWKGISLLMFACSGTSEHDAILNLLLEKNAEVNTIAKGADSETPLIWAASKGSLHAVQKLLEKGADKDKTNLHGLTPLMKAAECGHIHVVKELIKNGAGKWHKSEQDQIDDLPKNAMILAIMNGHIDLATECFMEDKDEHGRTLNMFDAEIEEVLSEDDLDLLAKKFSDIELQDKLLRLAAQYNFHFNLFIKLFNKFQNLNVVLNIGLKRFFEYFRDRKLRAGEYDQDYVFKMTNILAAINGARATHPLEITELQQCYDLVYKVQEAIFDSPTMNIEKNSHDAICYVTYDPNTLFKDKLIEKAYAFRAGPIALSLTADTSAIMSSGQLSMFIDEIFWSFLRRPIEERFSSDTLTVMRSLRTGFGVLKESKMYNSRLGRFLNNFKTLNSKYINVRYSVATMFVFEALSKGLCLALVAAISTRKEDFSPWFVEVTSYEVSTIEWLLMVHSFSLLLHEYGELCSDSVSLLPGTNEVKEYLRANWNIFDLCGLSLLTVWSLLTLIDPVEFHITAHGFLSLSAIFITIGMLRYMAVFESLGKLTIMLVAMSYDLISFGVVFLTCIFGFSVTLFGLLHGSNFNDNPDIYFQTYTNTFVTVFSAALGNYDRVMFSTTGPYYELSFAILLIYLVVGALVLNSLIVARMSATHNQVDERSFEQFQFMKATFVKAFLLVEEANPASMLPAPLNLISVLIAPVHWVVLTAQRLILQENMKHHDVYLARKLEQESRISRVACEVIVRNFYPIFSFLLGLLGVHIVKKDQDGNNATVFSLCGTVSDKILGIIMAFLAPIFELLIVFRRVTMDAWNNGLTLQLCLESFLFLLIFPIVYPFFTG